MAVSPPAIESRSLCAKWRPLALAVCLLVGQLVVSSDASAQGLVSAAGTITLNGQPATNRQVYFWRAPTEVATQTDEVGRYLVNLPSAGDWMVVIRNWSQTGRFTAQEGNTQSDWSVEGGLLEVTLQGADAPATIAVRRAAPDFLSTRAIPSGVSSYTFEAIPLGTFLVRASNELGTSETVTVTFTPFDLHQQVRLKLPQ